MNIHEKMKHALRRTITDDQCVIAEFLVANRDERYSPRAISALTGVSVSRVRKSIFALKCKGFELDNRMESNSAHYKLIDIKVDYVKKEPRKRKVKKPQYNALQKLALGI